MLKIKPALKGLALNLHEKQLPKHHFIARSAKQSEKTRMCEHFKICQPKNVGHD